MRLWHYKLLPYLPDAQFKGQLRELVAIMHDWRDKSKTNHLLITLRVIPETVGQYTGLTDKNGTKIFEGDIVRTDKGKIYEVKMQKGCWIVWNDKAKMTYDKWDFLNTFAPTIEVIGNLHNNPELLKDG